MGPNGDRPYVAVQQRLLELEPIIPIAVEATFEAVTTRVQSYEPRMGYGNGGVSLGKLFSQAWLKT